MTITKSSITDNFSDGPNALVNDGGTVTITKSTIAYNVGIHFSGGLWNMAGTVFITTTTFAFNVSDGASAIVNDGTLTITDSAFTDNASYLSGRGTIRNRGMLTITNTTLARNVAIDSFDATGAAIWNAGTAILTNSTLGDNGHGGRVRIGSTLTSAPGATTLVQNTLLARNVGSGGGGPDCLGVVTSLGHNLIGDPTGCTLTLQPTDLTGDPGFDAFTENGTPGHGHYPLLPTSQAIDAGNNAVCPRRDQIGQRRKGRCDIGAIAFPQQGDPLHSEDIAAVSQ